MLRLAIQRYKKEKGKKYKTKDQLWSYIKENKGNPYACFRLTDMKKMGINPKSEFKEAIFGLYAYPMIPYAITQLKSNRLTHAGDMPYIYTLEVKKSNTILIKMDGTTPGYNSDNLRSDVEQIKKWYPDVDYEKVGKNLEEWYKKKSDFGDFQKLYHFTLLVGRQLANEDTAGVKVTAIMIKLGVYAIIDLAATFHFDSPFEAVILKPGHFTNLQIFDNSTKQSNISEALQNYNYADPDITRSFKNLIEIIAPSENSLELADIFLHALRNGGFEDTHKEMLSYVLERVGNNLIYRLLKMAFAIRPELLDLEFKYQDDKITGIVSYLKNYKKLADLIENLKEKQKLVEVDEYGYSSESYKIDKEISKIQDQISGLERNLFIDYNSFGDMANHFKHFIKKGKTPRDLIEVIKRTEIESTDNLISYLTKLISS